jgi:glycosyltransferase involved in cell wall biosynthesis
LRIAIIGTKGIPNRYGGFEAFAQRISLELSKREINVTVFQPSNSSDPLDEFNGVSRIPVYVNPKLPKNLGRILYNLKSLVQVNRINFDCIICCGHSPGLFFPFFPKRTLKRIVVNMDGLEWKREKWGITAKTLLKLTERLAINYAGAIVADNRAIQNYIKKAYDKESYFISYGADFDKKEGDETVLSILKLTSKCYGLVIARLEPENNIEIAIKAFAELQKTLVIVGNTETKLAKKLIKKYSKNSNILFKGAIYNDEKLNTLRSHCNVYIHGHSVGGTNPSLLDAMASGCLIIAHSNPFNGEVLSDGGYYYSDQVSLKKLIHQKWDEVEKKRSEFAKYNYERIKLHYSWETVALQYLELLKNQAQLNL